MIALFMVANVIFKDHFFGTLKKNQSDYGDRLIVCVQLK